MLDARSELAMYCRCVGRLLASAARVSHEWIGDRRVLVDVALAGFLTVLALVEAVSELDAWEREVGLLAVVFIVTGGVSLVWRRRAPVLVLAIVSTVMIAYWLSNYGSFLALLGLPALFAVAAHSANRRRAWVAIGVGSVALLIGAGISILDRPDGFAYANAVSMAAYLAGASAVGVIVRNRHRIFVDTQRRAVLADASRLAEAQTAVAAERARIAREMHDVVAHGMSVIAVQAAAAQEIVHNDPDKAAEVLGRIANVGRESLSEMRRMLGALRTGEDGGASLTPQPKLTDVAIAVAQSNQSGVATTYVVNGRVRDLPPGIELAGYRTVQEALTNVRKHAGQSVSAAVRIDYLPDALSLEITDDGDGASSFLSDSGSTNGLIGIRERVEIYEGQFFAGPRPTGGYSVRVILPTPNTSSRPSVISAASRQRTPST
jgi:signal transduction histidine kinase